MLRHVINKPIPQAIGQRCHLIARKGLKHALELYELIGMFGAMFVDDCFAYYPVTGARQICPGGDVAHERIFVPKMLHRREIKTVQQIRQLLRCARAGFHFVDLIYDSEQTLMFDVDPGWPIVNVSRHWRNTFAIITFN